MKTEPKRMPACILGTCCVPWDGQYRFQEARFRNMMAGFLEHGTRHLYIFGTAGEGYAVTDTQFDAITRVFCRDMLDAGAAPMVGVISLSPGTVLERIRRARDLGARDFQISLPAWGACGWDDIRRFFEAVCGRFPDCRFLHYNLVRAKRLIRPAEYAELAAAHPNLVATKSGGDSLAGVSDLLTTAPALRHFLTESAFMAATLLGLKAGLLISISSIHWPRARRFFRAAQTGDLRTLRRDGQELRAIHALLMRCMENGTERMDGAYDKMFCRLADPRFPLRLLPPYEGASEKAFRLFVRGLRRDHPAWIS